MPYPSTPWRDALLPASYAGAGFHVEGGGKSGGRRLSVHEYPKADTPNTEDMGRKARRWSITGYVIGPFYIDDRDALIAVCEAEGPATLVHPTMGEEQVRCESFSVTESREQGGIARFEMAFVEAGQDPGTTATADTQAQVGTAADASNATAASTMDSGLAQQGGVGSDAVASAQATTNYTPVTTPTASPSDSFGGPSAPTSYPSGISGIGFA